MSLAKQMVESFSNNCMRYPRHSGGGEGGRFFLKTFLKDTKRLVSKGRDLTNFHPLQVKMPKTNTIRNTPKKFFMHE